jgi:hypothetical protein
MGMLILDTANHDNILSYAINCNLKDILDANNQSISA